MGVSTSGTQLAAKLDTFAREVASSRGAIRETGLFVQGVMEGARTSAGVSAAKAPIRMRQLKDDTCLVYGTGLATIIDQGAKSHFIAPRDNGRRRSNRTRKGGLTKFATGAALASLLGGSAGAGIGGALGGGAAAEAGHPVPIVHHPGSKGKHFWRVGRVRAEREAPNVLLRAQVTVPMKRVFG